MSDKLYIYPVYSTALELSGYPLRRYSRCGGAKVDAVEGKDEGESGRLAKQLGGSSLTTASAGSRTLVTGPPTPLVVITDAVALRTLLRVNDVDLVRQGISCATARAARTASSCCRARSMGRCARSCAPRTQCGRPTAPRPRRRPPAAR